MSQAERDLRHFSDARPQPEIQQVYAEVLRGMARASALLFVCGLHDELGNWLHQPTEQHHRPAWVSA